MKTSFTERRLCFPASGRFKIDARTKPSTGTGKKNNAHAVILRDDIQTIVEFTHHGIGDPIEIVRSIHGDRGSSPIDFVKDRFVIAHPALPFLVLKKS